MAPDVTACPVALVHVGSPPPDYAVANARMLAARGLDVVLATDHPLSNRDMRVQGIEQISVNVSREHARVASGLGDHARYRRGFWALTAVRLAALSHVHRNMGGRLIHIEGDVLLHPEFPWSHVAAEEPLSWGILGSGRDSAALFGSTDPDATEDVARYVVDALASGGSPNEMAALRGYRECHPDSVAVMPTAPDDSPVWFQGGVDDDTRSAASRLAAQWGGIVDVAGIGQYLLGTDPRNDRGFSHLGREFADQTIRPSSFAYGTDAHGWPTVDLGDRVLPIWSLHVHSKARRMFQGEGLRAAIHRSVCSGQGPRRVFVPGALVSSMRERLHRALPSPSKVADRAG